MHSYLSPRLSSVRSPSWPMCQSADIAGSEVTWTVYPTKESNTCYCFPVCVSCLTFDKLRSFVSRSPSSSAIVMMLVSTCHTTSVSLFRCVHNARDSIIVLISAFGLLLFDAATPGSIFGWTFRFGFCRSLVIHIVKFSPDLALLKQASPRNLV